MSLFLSCPHSRVSDAVNANRMPVSAKTVMDSDFELHVGLRHIWVEARHHAAMDRVPFRWGDEHGSWEEPCCEVYAKYTDVSGAHKKARDAGMHLGILKVLDTFRAPFGFGKGFEAAGRVALFIAILSLGFIVVALGLCCLGTHVSVEVFLVSTLAVCVHNSLSTFAVRKRCSDIAWIHMSRILVFCLMSALCVVVLCSVTQAVLSALALLTWYQMTPPGWHVEVGGQVLEMARGTSFWTMLSSCACCIAAAVLAVCSGTYKHQVCAFCAGCVWCVHMPLKGLTSSLPIHRNPESSNHRSTRPVPAQNFFSVP
jgi:hypothetical protein